MNNLKSRRKQLGMTQEQVARKMDITCRNYQRYETGDGNPTIKNAIKLANVLNCTLDELFNTKRIS